MVWYTSLSPPSEKDQEMSPTHPNHLSRDNIISEGRDVPKQNMSLLTSLDGMLGTVRAKEPLKMEKTEDQNEDKE
jgi:hypothetical protein